MKSLVWVVWQPSCLLFSLLTLALTLSVMQCMLPTRHALMLRVLRWLACLQAVDSFLEELVVRRELADNFCFFQPQYDSLEGAWSWARTTLNDHRNDKREFVYT